MSKTLLLADDSVTIQKVVELTFLDEEVEVVAVSNGTQALARLAEIEPDLVVADVHMPGAGGLEVCRESKRQRPWVPVLLLVGTFEPFEPGEATAAGADSYLKKPFDSQELLRQAKELMAAGGKPARPAPAPVVAPPLPASEPWEALAEEEAPPTQVRPPADMRWERSVLGAPLDVEIAPPPPAEGPAALPAAPGDLPEEPAAALPAAVAAETAPAAQLSGLPVVLADADIERIARRVAELLAPQIVRDVAWEVVPDLAEVAIRARIRELESEVE